jgi:hypothetical protein
MNDKEKKPQEYDVVLGGNNPPPVDGLVLGGKEGIVALQDIVCLLIS